MKDPAPNHPLAPVYHVQRAGKSARAARKECRCHYPLRGTLQILLLGVQTPSRCNAVRFAVGWPYASGQVIYPTPQRLDMVCT